VSVPDDSGSPVELLLDESAEELYEHAPCGYLSTLPDGRIVRVNRTFVEWVGTSRAALL
jgi:PAS domain-containing protein